MQTAVQKMMRSRRRLSWRHETHVWLERAAGERMQLRASLRDLQHTCTSAEVVHRCRHPLVILTVRTTAYLAPAPGHCLVPTPDRCLAAASGPRDDDV